jgi:hypothetical protein
MLKFLDIWPPEIPSRSRMNAVQPCLLTGWPLVCVRRKARIWFVADESGY